MAEDSFQAFRDLMAGTAGILQIDLSADEVVGPMTFHFEDMEATLTHDPRGDDHALIFSVPFGRVPPGKEAEIYREFLDANLFWAGTGGATIGVETDTGESVLCLRMNLAGLQPAQVAATAAEMIEMGLIWKHVVTEAERDGTMPSEDQIIRA